MNLQPQNPQSQLQITLFGAFEVRLRDQPLPPVRTRKVLWLLALLVLHHPTPLERAWIAATLWPDSDPEQALYNLRRSLSSLREALGDASERLLTPSAHTLALDLSGAGVDLVEFDAALKAGGRSALQQAVSLYRGPLLASCSEEWALPERRVREENYLAALERLAGQALESGESREAVGYLRRVVEADPLREGAQRLLMEALALQGEYGAAVGVYRALRLHLRAELNTEPDAQTRRLYARLRETAKREAAEGGASSRLHPDLPAEFSPLKSLDGFPHNLPRQLTSLIGREQEITEIRTLLGQTALLTLTGSGGCGKTRLALQVGAEALEEYADGVWLVELAPLADPALVAQEVASALGLTEQAGKPLTHTLREHLKGKRLLLVLDNCEHLLSACALLAADLLRHCAHLRVLTTSRQSLGIMGEVSYRVPSLETPPEDRSSGGEKDRVAWLLEYASVRLFVERASAAASGFKVTGENVGAIAAICRGLDGIPLAIEMAAARVKALSPAEIASRLSARLALLTRGSRTASPRQQTLRALLDWSYDLLSEPEQILLARLSVFASGWTLEAAESVCGAEEGVQAFGCSGIQGHAEPSPEHSNAQTPERLNADEVLDLLSDLVDKSLVVAEERSGGERYRLLETVREYAWEKLAASGKAARIQSRHRDHFLALAEEVKPKLAGSEQVYWLSVLEGEHDNLRAALAFCLDEAEGGAAGLRLGRALWWFWSVRGYLSEGRRHLAAVLAHPVGQAHQKVRAEALNGAGVLARMQGDYAATRALHEESLAIYRELGERRGIAATLNNLGNVAFMQSDYASALPLYEESLAIRRELGNRQGIAVSLTNLGIVAHELGDYVSARPLHEESLAIHRELGNRQGIAVSLNNLGFVASLQGDYASARPLYEESLAFLRELGDRQGIATSLINLGNVAQDQGDTSSSHGLYEESLAIYRELGNRPGIALALHGLGLVASLQGDYASARPLLEESLAIRRELGDKRGIATSLVCLGYVNSKHGDYVAARALLEESLTIRRELGEKASIAECLDAFAELAHREQYERRAAQLWAAATALREAIGSPRPMYGREEYDREISEARSALDEDVFAAAWEEGRVMTWEQAVACVLGETPL